MAVDARRVKELFGTVIEIPEAAARAAYLERECGNDADLRLRLEALLNAHDAPASALQQPLAGEHTGAYVSAAGAAAGETAGAIIAGKYKLLQQIGEGGMGSVWMADQTEPVKRRVAVKLIRTERSSSKTILARFEAERQAIALMDHPNIAKLLDAGETPPTHVGGSAQPYFVMELVKGVPLTEFCDQHKFSIPDRLSLFIQICSAVQHAHQKGIIHRDLKPSNILVELHDDKPVPRVIDFGLAKATSGMQLTENTLFTGFGTVAGTPLYMAPEQANFNAVDIDTRADVYALGVILYELLTGSTPISRETIKKAALDEMMKLIREQEAPTPSSRLSSSETKPTVAANRHSEPQKLGRYIKGELDWIVMKALSKERDRRYETANGFAKDIERFLNHEAVLAGPASAGYRLRKFVKRNSGKVLAAGLIILTLLGGIAGTTWGLVKATQQEHLANERARAEQQAREQAQIRLTQIEKNNQLITSIFDDVDITKIKKGKEPLEAVLARRLVKVAEQLDGETVGDPIMVADLQNKLGESLLHLGFATDAIPLFRKARDTQHVILGTNHHDTLASMNNLALSYREAGQFEKAIPLYEETLPLMQKVMGINHVDTLVSMSNLAEIYRATGKKNKALLLAEETLQLMKVKLGADHPLTITSLVNTAAAYQTAGQYEKALSFSKEALDRMSARQGLEHPDTLNSMSNLASIYLDLGEFDKAVALFESCLSLRRKIVGADHPDTLLTMNNLAMAYSDAGQNDKASRLYQEALEAIQKKLGSDHPLALVNLNNLASSYRDAGELDKALPLFEKASQGIEKLLFQYEHSDRIITNTIQAYERAKQYEKAVSWRSKWGIVVKQREGAESLQYVNELEGLGSNYLQQGKWTEAEQVLRTAWGIREKIKSEGWMNYRAQFMLGNALLGQKKYDEAEPLLLKGYEGMKQREKTIPQQSKIRLTEALDRLIQLYTETNKPDEVKIWQAVKGKLAKPVEKKN